MNKTLKLLLTLSVIKFHAMPPLLPNANNIESRTIRLKDGETILKKLIDKNNVLKNSYQNRIYQNYTNIIAREKPDTIVKEKPDIVEILNVDSRDRLQEIDSLYEEIKINFVITCYFSSLKKNDILRDSSNNDLKEINLEYIHNNRVIFTIEVMKNKENQDNFDLKAFFPEPSFFGKLTNYVASCFSLDSSSQSVDDGVSSSDEEKSERLPLLDSSEIKKNQ